MSDDRYKDKKTLNKEPISPKGKLFSGVAILTISTLIVKIIGLLYKIPMMRILGEEGMGYSDVSKLTVTKEYDESADYLLLSGAYDKLIMKVGDFCVTFPEDAHIPAMTAGGEGLKKAVVKIRL